MVSIEDYRKFVQVLNTSNDLRHKEVMTSDEFVMIASLDTKIMAPSKAKQVLNDMLKDGIVIKRGDFIRYGDLYDSSKKEFVVKSKTGKVLKSKVERPKEVPKRTVKYVAPGHTVVGYANRTLHIRFKETKTEYDARRKARRRAAMRNRTHDDTILVERDSSGNVRYISKSGSDVDLRANARASKGKTAIIKKNLSRDAYTLEDMRARLRDDHWEEVCGNKRWNYDPKATVREFNKYLKTTKR